VEPDSGLVGVVAEVLTMRRWLSWSWPAATVAAHRTDLQVVILNSHRYTLPSPAVPGPACGKMPDMTGKGNTAKLHH
jgi:hypothetical protein